MPPLRGSDGFVGVGNLILKAWRNVYEERL